MTEELSSQSAPALAFVTHSGNHMTTHEVQMLVEERVAKALEANSRWKYGLPVAEEDATSPFSAEIQVVTLPKSQGAPDHCL